MNRYLLILLLFVLIVLIYLYYRNVTHNILDRYDREKIYEFDGLLSKNECNRIIEMARPRLQKSTVMSKEQTHPGRTSSHVFLPTTNDLLRKVDQIVSSYLNIPSSHFEELQVVINPLKNMMLTMIRVNQLILYVLLILNVLVVYDLLHLLYI